MKILPLVILITFAMFAPSPSIANNTYFLPGDAFFFVRLNKGVAKQFGASDSTVLPYGNPFNGAAGCGYIGYEKIELTNLTPDVKQSISNAFSRLETEAMGDPKMDGNICMFIYSDKYDWKRFSIGMQYNENWADQAVTFGTIRDHTALACFSSDSVMRNWRDSSLVSPLPADCPALPDGHGKDFPMPWTKTPVKIDANDCCFILLPNRDFDSYINPTNGINLIEIANGKVTNFEWDNGKWQSKE